MRPIEISIVLVSAFVVAGVLWLRGRRPGWLRLLAAGAVVLVLAHAWFEGIHWQMFPVYLAVCVLLLVLFKRRSTKLVPLAAAAGVLLLMGVGLCWALPMFHLPPPTGKYPIGTRTLYMIDPSREETHAHAQPGRRQVVVQFWYPSATSSGRHAMYREWKETQLRSTYQAVLPVAAFQNSPLAPGRYPVILFNPAWNGFRNRSTFITQDLASQGFVVVGISHPYNSAFTALRDGYIANSHDEPDLGAYYKPESLQDRLNLEKSELAIQVADDRFVLDQLTQLDRAPGSPFYGHLDMTDVGAFGHSFGGAVSVETALVDPRVKCALEMDGALYGKAETQGLPKPLMRLRHAEPPLPPGSDHSSSEVLRVWAEMRDRSIAAFNLTFSRFGGYDVFIDGIDHENYTDKGFFSPIRRLTGIGTLPQKDAAAIINTYVRAFFLQVLSHRPQPLLNGSAPAPANSKLTVWPGTAVEPANATRQQSTADDAPQPAPSSR